MRGIEELERTTVVLDDLELLGTLSHIVLMNHYPSYPGVWHRTFGFRTLSNERHEFDTVHGLQAAIEPNRTNKKYSNWKKKLNAIFSKEFDWVRSSNGARSSLQKNTNGTKSSRSSVETAKAIWSFVSFITVKPVCNGPVLSSHPLLSGQFSKSGFFACTNAVFVPCSPTLSFFVILPVLGGRQPSTETKPYILLCNF